MEGFRIAGLVGKPWRDFWVKNKDKTEVGICGASCGKCQRCRSSSGGSGFHCHQAPSTKQVGHNCGATMVPHHRHNYVVQPHPMIPWHQTRDQGTMVEHITEQHACHTTVHTKVSSADNCRLHAIVPLVVLGTPYQSAKEMCIL